MKDKILDFLKSDVNFNITKIRKQHWRKGKKYSRTHLAYLTGICTLKHVLSTRDLDLLIREELGHNEHTVETGYNAFCASLDNALQAMANEIQGRPEGENPADAAIHFAMLSYAAGMASNRYISQLKAEKGLADTEKKKKK